MWPPPRARKVWRLRGSVFQCSLSTWNRSIDGIPDIIFITNFAPRSSLQGPLLYMYENVCCVVGQDIDWSPSVGKAVFRTRMCIMPLINFSSLLLQLFLPTLSYPTIHAQPTTADTPRP